MFKRDFNLKDGGQAESAIAVRMRYERGGADQVTGKQKAKGYYLAITPFSVVMVNSARWRLSTPDSGGSETLILEAPRRSKQRDRQAMEECRRRLPGLLNAVLRRTGFELEPYPDFADYTKIILPSTAEEYEAGVGEVVEIGVDSKVKWAFCSGIMGGRFLGVLEEDSIGYPTLKRGRLVEFEFGRARMPIARWDFLEAEAAAGGFVPRA